MKLQFSLIRVDIRVKARLDSPRIKVELVVNHFAAAWNVLGVYVACGEFTRHSLCIKGKLIVDIEILREVRANL